MTSLEPIYQKIDSSSNNKKVHSHSDQEDIELQSLEINDNKVEQEVLLAEKSEPSEVVPKTGKCKKAHSVRKVCKCIVVSYFVVALATAFVMAIVLGVAGYKVKHCIYPAVTHTKIFTYSEMDALAFDIPTGSIKFHTCPHAKNITVSIVYGAKTTELANIIKLNYIESARSLAVTAQAPSFNLQHCQIVHVDVTIPASLKTGLSVSASTNVGIIKFDTSSYHFGTVDASVNVGIIKSRKLSAQEIIAKAAFGGIVGCKFSATKEIHVATDIGGVCLSRVEAPKSTLEVQKGFIRTRNVDSKNVSAKVDYGFSYFNDISSDNFVSEIGYGRTWVEPSTSFSGSISFNTPQFGTFDVSASRGVTIPAILSYEQQQQAKQSAVQVQKITIADEKGSVGNSKFELKSVSGSVSVYLRRA